uniref:Uncharacterized protein n=1 Tax=Strongyloides papillosus TaxID=174720 RepID=A0A0N5BW99_STREA
MNAILIHKFISTLENSVILKIVIKKYYHSSEQKLNHFAPSIHLFKINYISFAINMKKIILGCVL